MTLKKFSHSLFHVCPLLSHWGDDHEQTFQSFLAYKTRVPVCGAIMLNETWDKVRWLSCGYGIALLRPRAVPACEGLEGYFCLEFSQRQDQRTGTKISLCSSRGVFDRPSVFRFVLMIV